MVGPLTEDGAFQDALSIGAFVWTATVDTVYPQTILAVEGESSGVALGVRGGVPFIEIVSEHGGWSLTGERRLHARAWYYVAGVAATSGEAQLVVEPCDPNYGHREHLTRAVEAVHLPKASIATVAARQVTMVEDPGGLPRGYARQHFNGKVEAPMVASTRLDADDVRRLASGATATDVVGNAVRGAWDFAAVADDDPNKVATLVGRGSGLLVNLPARGVTGRTWSGRHTSFQRAPGEYGAVHFHESDVSDVGWAKTLTCHLPTNLPSAVYGIQLTADDVSDTVPFTVLPDQQRRRQKLVVLLPTFTYLAYANELIFLRVKPNAVDRDEFQLTRNDHLRAGDRSFGLSLYDRHPDGSGVMYSSASRPILNMRHDDRSWLSESGRNFSADMYLIEWLERRNFDFDVLTDLELHQQGADAIAPYSTVVTGSHPEYYSEPMLDALEAYRDSGGNLMYLGGNGFYWVTGVYSADPLIVETRRGRAGTRPWDSYPGEDDLVSTSEPGGLWRHRGRPPQRLVGVGFCAQGWGGAGAFHRHGGAVSADSAWVFEGVDENPIGGYGRVMGGAAGDELDRADPSLGTLPGTLVLASSRDHGSSYKLANEESGGVHATPEGLTPHADMAYVRPAKGGQVFSVGSIAWCGALLVNECRNGVSRITENVIRRFARIYDE